MNTRTYSATAQSPRLLSIFLREAGYELLKQLRTPAFAIPTLVFPIAFYLVFAVLLPGNWGSLNRPLYLLATYGVFGVMGPALFGFGVGVAIERQNGLLDLKRVSPMPPGAYLFGKLMMSMLFGLVVLILLSAVAIAFGGVRIDPLRWLTLAAAISIGTLPFCALGLWIGTLVRGEAAVAIVNLVFLPMAVLSGLWIPLHVFPGWMQQAAVIWPAWHLGQIALGVVGQVNEVRYLWHIAILLLMSAGFLSLAARRLRQGD